MKNNNFLIVGLGNPEKKYFYTRHNLGFLACSYLAKFLGYPDFKENKKLKAFLTEEKVKNKKIIFALPNTYMNNSGLAAGIIKNYFQVPLDQIAVIHDDIDLDVGRMKISFASSAGGHKGVQSIIDHLDSNKFIRVRFGIKPKRISSPTESYVLKKMSKEEEGIYLEQFEKLPEAIELLAKGRLNSAMNRIN